MPESISGNLDINEMKIYKSLNATVTVNMRVANDWRVRIGLQIVKFGLYMMGANEVIKIVTQIDNIIHSLGDNDGHENIPNPL